MTAMQAIEPRGWAQAVVEAGAPDVHPLRAARARVDSLLCAHRAELVDLALALALAPGDAIRLVRAAALQALCRIHHARVLAEQFHYNLLYRWFLELDDGATLDARIPEWLTDGSLRRSPQAGVLMAALRADPAWRALAQDDYFLAGPDDSAARGFRETADTASTGHAEWPADRLSRLRAYIVRNIDQPGLNPNHLASALCLSRRALYGLLAEQGQTPTRMIQTLRLERCRARLGDPREQAKITTIAFDNGFRDYATFSRLFKAHFRLTPSALRRQALAVRPGAAPVAPHTHHPSTATVVAPQRRPLTNPRRSA